MALITRQEPVVERRLASRLGRAPRWAVGCLLAALVAALAAPPASAERPFRGPRSGRSARGHLVDPLAVPTGSVQPSGAAFEVPAHTHPDTAPSAPRPAPRPAPILALFEEVDLLEGGVDFIDRGPEAAGRPTRRSTSVLSEGPRRTRRFRGLSRGEAGGGFPADPNVAAGPDAVVEVVNSVWRAFSRSGRPLTGVIPFCREAGFWRPALGDLQVGCFDPKVLYDPHAERFVMLALAVRRTRPFASFYLLAVSQTSDPLAGWCTWTLNARRDGRRPSGTWADYPGLGVDRDRLYITSNQVPFERGRHSTRLRILSKDELLDPGCRRLPWVDFFALHREAGIPATTVQPALAFDAASGGHFVTRGVPILDPPAQTLNLWRLVADGDGAPRRLVRHDLVIGRNGLDSAGEAPQCGGARPLLLNGWVVHSFIRDGQLWLTFAGACRSDHTVSCVRLVRIDLATRQVAEEISYGAPGQGWHYYYPAIMVDEAGDLFLVFNASREDTCAQVRYAGRREGASTIADSRRLKPGRVPHQPSRFGARWGDYSGIALDAATGRGVWVGAQYPTRTEGADSWSTVIGRLGFPTALPTAQRGRPLLERATLVWEGTSFAVEVAGRGIAEVALEVLSPAGHVLAGASASGEESLLRVEAPAALGWPDGDYRFLLTVTARGGAALRAGIERRLTVD